MTEHVDILQQLSEIEANGLSALEAAQDEKDLQAWRIAQLGRSAPVMLIFGGLGRVPQELRAAVGQRANAVKQALEAAHAARVETLKARALAASLETERLDVTLPGRQPARAAAPHQRLAAPIAARFQRHGLSGVPFQRCGNR